MLWTVLLVLLIIFLLGGWGYGRNSGGSYGNPMGILGVVFVVVLVVWFFSGHAL